jgi:Xaa-Pro aminopeptidase
MTDLLELSVEEGQADAKDRLERLQERLDESDFDALVLSAEANFTYVTGYTTPSWAMTARPMALVVTPKECIAVVGSAEAEPLGKAAPHVLIAPYTEPIARDLDGLPFLDFAATTARCVAQLLQARGADRVGIEGSVPSASGLPYDSLRVLADLARVTLADASGLLWKARLTKSAYEIARLLHAGAALGRLYELFASRAEIGMTERELHGLLLSAAGEAGCDRLGYSTLVAGAGTVADGAPSARRWERGELLYVDIGLVLDGYWADFSRHFGAGEATPEQLAAYERVAAAARAGRDACQSGAEAAAVARAIYANLPVANAGIGRVGHGLGLDLTEPPSVNGDDATVLTPGMTLAVEPLGAFSFGVLFAEENLVVTEAGPELLSPPFPTSLPIIS